MRTTLQRPFGFLLVILLLVGGICSSESAVAQGAGGMVAEPMGLREARSFLERYSQLREDQWAMVETAHDRYLKDFESLREGVIEDYLQDMQRISGSSMGSIPNLDELEELFRSGKRVNRRIESIDNAFFESLGPNLDEAQVPGLQRARSARARNRQQASAMIMNGGYGMQTLEESLWGMQPTPEELAAIDGALKGYESRMTKLGAKLEEESGRIMLNMVEALVAAGFGDVDEQSMVDDPEKTQEMMEILPQVMAESTQGLQELRGKMFDCESSFVQLRKRKSTFSQTSRI